MEKIRFIVFYRNVGAGKTKEIYLKEILGKMEISYLTFSKKIKNNKFTQLEKDYLRDRFKREFDFRTEEEIKLSQTI